MSCSSALILIAALAGVPLLAAAQSMRFEKIAYPRAVSTFVTGINDQGTIIGSYTLADQPAAPRGLACVPTHNRNCITELVGAFIYAHKAYKPLWGPTGSSIQLVAINNHDQVVLLDSHGNRWLLYDIAKDTFTPIGMSGHLATPKGIRTIRIQNIKGLNDKGEILGSGNGNLVIGVPALGTPDSLIAPTQPGEFRTLPRCAGGSEVTGINAQDQISGLCHLNRRTAAGSVTTGFILKDGTFQSVEEPGAIVTWATGINNSGVITGFYQPQKTDLSRSFVYDGSKFSELPVTFSANGNLPGVIRASAINDRGQVVGFVQGSAGMGNIFGFIATPGGR